MSISRTNFNHETINFINKKVGQYISSISQKNYQELIKKFVDKQNGKRQINQSADFCIDYERIRKVASEVQFLGYDKEYCMIFGIYGPKVDYDNKNELFYTINQIIQQSFYSSKTQKNQNSNLETTYKKHSTPGISFIFFNNMLKKKRKTQLFSKKHLPSPLTAQQFKQQIIKKLQLKNITKINHIILLYPSLFRRSWNYLTSFGLQNYFYDNYFTYIDQIYDLVSLLGPLFKVEQIDQKVLDYNKNKLFENEGTKKNWKQIYGKNDRMNQTRRYESYEKLCEQLNGLGQKNMSKKRFQYKKRLNEYMIDEENKIPVILKIFYELIEQRYINYQGIFRKVADEQELVKFEDFVDTHFTQQVEPNHEKKVFEHKTQAYFKIREQILTNFQVQTITSFIKKVLSNIVKQQMISLDIYERMLILNEQKQLEEQGKSFGQKKLSQIMNQFQQEKIKEQFGQQQEIKEKDKSKSDFLSKVAFFENLSGGNKSKLQMKGKNIETTSESRQKIKFNKVQGVKRDISHNENLIPLINILPTNNANTKNDTAPTTLPQKPFLFQQLKHHSPLHYTTLKNTIFLLHKLSKNQKFNLMSSHNLSICFVPCFFNHFMAKQQNTSEFSSENEQMNIMQRTNRECALMYKLIGGLQIIIDNPERYFR